MIPLALIRVTLQCDPAPREDAVTLGEKIRVARLEQKLTQEQLAGTDLTKSYISEIERGHRSPRLITLKALARRLNKPLSHFLDGVPEDREVEAFLRLGLVRLRAGMAGSACAPLERALELAVQQGDEVLQARVELALAAVDHELGHIQRAQRRVDRCFRVLARAGETASLVAAHSCLGRIKLASGDPDSALWAFQAAIQLAGQQPDHLVRGTEGERRVPGDALVQDIPRREPEARLEKTEDADRAQKEAGHEPDRPRGWTAAQDGG